MKPCPNCEIMFSSDRFEYHLKTCSFVVTDISAIQNQDAISDSQGNPFTEDTIVNKIRKTVGQPEIIKLMGKAIQDKVRVSKAARKNARDLNLNKGQNMVGSVMSVEKRNSSNKKHIYLRRNTMQVEKPSPVHGSASPGIGV